MLPRIRNNSEAIPTTVNYHLGFPERFPSLDHARGCMTAFIDGYTTRDRRSGLNYYTLSQVRNGTHHQVHQHRQDTLAKYYQQRPERFRMRPLTPALLSSASINHQINPKVPPKA